jgi:hypothetical protein
VAPTQTALQISTIVPGFHRRRFADSEPHDAEEKYRAFEVTDPSGFLLTISSEHQA